MFLWLAGVFVWATTPLKALASISPYIGCDVEVLAARWGQSYGEAKATIERKLGLNMRSWLESQLRNAKPAYANRVTSPCYIFSKRLVQWNDIEALAKSWGVSAWDAKLRAEREYLRYGAGRLSEQVSFAHHKARQQAPVSPAPVAPAAQPSRPDNATLARNFSGKLPQGPKFKQLRDFMAGRASSPGRIPQGERWRALRNHLARYGYR